VCYDFYLGIFIFASMYYRENEIENIDVDQSVIVNTDPQEYWGRLGNEEKVEFDVVQGDNYTHFHVIGECVHRFFFLDERNYEAANVIGPNDDSVQDSEYAADRRQHNAPAVVSDEGKKAVDLHSVVEVVLSMRVYSVIHKEEDLYRIVFRPIQFRWGLCKRFWPTV
jgi:hypothetical protein